MLESYLLFYFQALAETPHITQTAERLDISPSALSVAIRKLETKLGAPLFDRTGRSIVLNDYGRTFLPYAERILALMEEAEQKIAQRIEADAHTLVIADMMSSLSVTLIANFLVRHPDIHVRREYVHPAEVAGLDMAHRFDLLIGSTNAVQRPELIHITLRESTRIVAIVNEKNPLARFERISLRQLSDVPLITYRPGYAGRILLDTVFREAGMQPNILFEGNSPHSLAPALAADLGVCLLSSHTVQQNQPLYPGCRSVPIEDCSYRSNTSIFIDGTRPRSKAATAFLDFARKFCQA